MSTIDVENVFSRFFILVTFFTFSNVFLFFNFFKDVGLKLRAASRLTTSTFKITATKFNKFINNRILYPLIRM